MATTNTKSAPSYALKAYEDRINAQMQEAKAKLQQLDATATEKGAQAEIVAINDLNTATQNIDRKLQDLKTMHDCHETLARTDFHALWDAARDVAMFRASIDDLAAKFTV